MKMMSLSIENLLCIELYIYLPWLFISKYVQYIAYQTIETFSLSVVTTLVFIRKMTIPRSCC